MSQVSSGATGALQNQNRNDFLVFAKSPNSNIIANILGTIANKKDQLVTVTLKPTGIKFTIEEARSIQGTAFLQKDLWQEYFYANTEDERFTMNLSVFMECLNIFGPVVAQQNNPPLIQIAYRGYGSPFLAMLEANDVLIDCAVRTLDAEPLMLFNLKNAEIMCKVIVKSEALKEAFNELDWSNVSCEWTISNDQPYFRLSTDGSASSCQVDYPRDSEVFLLYECYKKCTFRYKLKHMQPCAKALAVAQKTQIRINAQGLLSMQHRIHNEDGSPSFVEYYLVPLDDDESNVVDNNSEQEIIHNTNIYNHNTMEM